MKNKFNIGIGLRNKHYPKFDESLNSQLDFFEIISENYINTKGRPFELMLRIRERYPILMHGVSLNIGSTDDLNFDYLSKLKSLIEIVQPELTSDHLCFTGLKEKNLHNLLPFAYTKENLERISHKVDQVQSFLNRQFIFENLSAYFTLKNSEMSEAQFLNNLCEKTGCGILFDINNLYVNSINQNFSPEDFLKDINFKHVKQFHLAGFSDFGDYLFDTHSEPVYPQVWDLYKLIISQKPNSPVLIEWDENIPDFNTVEAEALKAKQIAIDMKIINEVGDIL